MDQGLTHMQFTVKTREPCLILQTEYGVRARYFEDTAGTREEGQGKGGGAITIIELWE